MMREITYLTGYARIVPVAPTFEGDTMILHPSRLERVNHPGDPVDENGDSYRTILVPEDAFA
jgi:hypothetical protein